MRVLLHVWRLCGCRVTIAGSHPNPIIPCVANVCPCYFFPKSHAISVPATRNKTRRETKTEAPTDVRMTATGIDRRNGTKTKTNRHPKCHPIGHRIQMHHIAIQLRRHRRRQTTNSQPDWPWERDRPRERERDVPSHTHPIPCPKGATRDDSHSR